MTKIYTIFLPSHTHDDEKIGEIHYEAAKKRRPNQEPKKETS